MPKLGDAIPLSYQLFDGATNKFVRAILRDASGTALPASPVTLSHVSDGIYEDISVLMPNTTYVSATFQVFDDAAFTIPSDIQSDGTELYELTIIDQDLIDLLLEIKVLLTQLILQGVNIPLTGEILGETTLEGVVEAIDEIMGQVEPDEDIDGNINEEDQICTDIQESETLEGDLE